MGEEEEEKWFSRWEEELPKPEELIPLSQTLITTDLAVAFDIPTNNNNNNNNTNTTPPPPPRNDGETNISIKKPRLVWTPQLHKRFVEAVAHLGIKNAVPKTIMQLMNVDGLTRENVASHLQKYRLYLKRMQQQRSGGSSSSFVVGDSDRLFATVPVPTQFLRAPPFGPAGAMQHYRPAPTSVMTMVPPGPGMRRVAVFRSPQPPSYVEELEAGKQMAGRRVLLSLFPDGKN